MKRRSTKLNMLIAAALLIMLAASLCLSGCGAKAEPQLKNGDFESVGSDGLPEGWHTNVYYPESGSVNSEQDAVRGGVVHISSSGLNDARLVYTVAVEPDTEYELSCYVKTSGVEGGAGANVSVFGVAVASPGVYGTSDWQRVSLTGKTGPDQKELEFSLCLGGHGAVSKGEAWFDGARIALADKGASNGVMLCSDNAGGGEQGSDKITFPTRTVLGWSAFGAVLMAVLFILHRIYASKPLSNSRAKAFLPVLPVLAAALIIRIILAYLPVNELYGHKTDINCFVAWGRRVAVGGPAAFYTEWCDYPPGYMLVLGVMYKIGSIFGASAATYAMLIKLPAILADILSAMVVYGYAQRRMNLGAAVTLAAFVAFTPVLAYISSVWGQIDQVLALLLVIPILFLYDRKPIFAGLVYGAAIIIKPQALMAGPLFAAAYLVYVFRGSPYKKFAPRKGLARFTRSTYESVWLRLLETVLAVIAALAVIFAFALLFKGDQAWGWLIGKYYGTATSYKYATVNAYNFWAMIGANWASTDTPFLGLTYGKWGTVFMAAAVLLSIAAYLYAELHHKKCKGALPLVMAFMFSAIFTFGHYMHERYVFPVLLLLVIAYLFYNDRRLLWSYLAYGVTLLVNCLAAFYYADLMDAYRLNNYDYNIIFNDSIILWCSIANMAAFALLAYITADLVIRNKPFRGYHG